MLKVDMPGQGCLPRQSERIRRRATAKVNGERNERKESEESTFDFRSPIVGD
jgi:hypothetical protein